jgi:hypothetical protein
MASIINASSTGSGGLISTGDASGVLQLQNNGSATLTMDTSGNVGIGVTPASWYTPDYKALQVSNYASFYGRIGTNETGVMNNMYRNASAQYTYLNSAPAAWYYISGSSHNWTSSASGTAGTAVTTTQVLSVDRGTTLALQGASSITGCGISFPATQVASSDANTLDDYEEGTWTPTALAGLTVSGTFSSVGNYTKIGRMVYLSGYVGASVSVSATAGSVPIGGLPFTSITSPQQPGVGIVGPTNSGGFVLAYGTTIYAVSAFNTTTYFFNITYQV